MFIRFSNSRCADRRERNASSLLSMVVSVGGILAEPYNKNEREIMSEPEGRRRKSVGTLLVVAYLITVHRKGCCVLFEEIVRAMLLDRLLTLTSLTAKEQQHCDEGR